MSEIFSPLDGIHDFSDALNRVRELSDERDEYEALVYHIICINSVPHIQVSRDNIKVWPTDDEFKPANECPYMSVSIH